MTLLTKVAARAAGLRPAETADVVADRALKIVLPDGVTLLADRYYPRNAAPERCPVLLTRTPYGRTVEGVIGRLYAERGYQVVVVSCRGTFGSGGEWYPFFNEEADGRAVLEWLGRQVWCSEAIGLFGASYVGLTQWAVIHDPPVPVAAWAPSVTSANFRELMYPGGVFAMETAVVWIDGVTRQGGNLLQTLLTMRGQRARLRAAFDALPVSEADVVDTGGPVSYYRDWVDHEAPGDPWWAPLDFRHDLQGLPPASLTAGWYDIFCASQVADFEALTAAGNDARLQIGPWTHTAPAGFGAIVRETLACMDAAFKGATRPDDERVRLFVMGSKQWRSFARWPPPATTATWHLHEQGGLSAEGPAPSPPDRFRFDPADPTPGIGGPSLSRRNSGPKDNRIREARADVLTYTSPPVDRDVTIIGPVSARLSVRSSVEDTDFFVRLCDVGPSGRSTNLCEGIVRVRPGDWQRDADGIAQVAVALSPTAHTFLAGHRLRVQVSSGAHPVYARNTGSGEPMAKATTLAPAAQEVFHDPDHPSVIELPVIAP